MGEAKDAQTVDSMKAIPRGGLSKGLGNGKGKSTPIVEPRHSVFVGNHWNSCFVCQGTGKLMCCDSCPTKFHAACVGADMDVRPWKCIECASGQLGEQHEGWGNNYTKEELDKIHPEDQLHALYVLTELIT